jgi:threonyl-tRNA synthetase
MAKIPYMLIIGEKEKADNTITVRMRDGKNLPPMSIKEVAAKIEEESRQGRGI